MSNPNISLESSFHFDQVDSQQAAADSSTLQARSLLLQLNPGLINSLIQNRTLASENTTQGSPLGDLVGFCNPVNPTLGMVFAGNGFNTIFRPQSSKTPTVLPHPSPGDNVLELNLTAETLSFSAPLGNVPNRGIGSQADIFLNGIPYVQAVNDITTGSAVGIHFEPGIWLAVPPTTTPAVGITTYSRMASIPHGVTINAQGASSGRINGAPTIPPVNINPFGIGGTQAPPNQPGFPSQTATNQTTARIPQDLSSFISAGTLTQAMITDPNSVLRTALTGQNVQSFVSLVLTTDNPGTQPTPPAANPPAPAVPTPPGVAGGTSEIGFLRGDNHNPPSAPNAHAFKMTCIFWIETIMQTLVVPPCKANGLPITIQAPARAGSALRPTFTLVPPADITANKTITVPYTQIQYSQTVFLNFNGLTWPHVSVATLIPTSPIVVSPTLL